MKLEIEKLVSSLRCFHENSRRGRQWLDFLKTRLALALAGNVVTAAEGEAWTGDIESAATAGRFLFAVPQFVVTGTVA